MKLEISFAEEGEGNISSFRSADGENADLVASLGIIVCWAVSKNGY